jgi:hypothetical protein
VSSTRGDALAQSLQRGYAQLVQMAVPSSFLSADAFAADVRDARAEVRSAGVRTAATRFEKYSNILDEVGGLTYPRPFPFESDPAKRELYFEAVANRHPHGAGWSSGSPGPWGHPVARVMGPPRRGGVTRFARVMGPPDRQGHGATP